MQSSGVTIFKKYNRLCLRAWKEEDVNPYAELVGDPEVMKYISNGIPRDTETARREIENFSKEILEQGWSRWAVSVGEDGPFIGYAGFSKKPYGTDFGMRFLPQYWGNPHTYIACCLALEYGFEEIRFQEIRTITNKNHQRGLSFMKKLFSSTPTEATLGTDEFKMYIISRDEYIEKEYAKNRIKMSEHESAWNRRTATKIKPQENDLRSALATCFVPQLNGRSLA